MKQDVEDQSNRLREAEPHITVHVDLQRDVVGAHDKHGVCYSQRQKQDAGTSGMRPVRQDADAGDVIENAEHGDDRDEHGRDCELVSQE